MGLARKSQKDGESYECLSRTSVGLNVKQIISRCNDEYDKMNRVDLPKPDAISNTEASATGNEVICLPLHVSMSAHQPSRRQDSKASVASFID